MRIKEAVNAAIKQTAWSKTAIARELGLLPQGLNDKLIRRKNPDFEFVATVLSIVGYELAIVPKDSQLPDGSILVGPDKD